MNWNRTRMSATAIAFLVITGLTFGGQRSVNAEGDSAEGDNAESKSAKNAVKGVVKFDGPTPRRKQIAMREKGGVRSACHDLHDSVLLDENLIVGKAGEVANVFVYVKKGLEKKSYPVPKKAAVLNQKKCMFQPRVQGVQIGQTFTMKNGDPLTHNVRAFSFRNRPYNVAQKADSEDRTKVFTKREKAVMIQCDIHPWMKAYYFVMDHPYYAVTNKKGEFSIPGLPAGEYTLATWHEELGEQDVKITVDKTGATVGFTYQPKSRD